MARCEALPRKGVKSVCVCSQSKVKREWFYKPGPVSKLSFISTARHRTALSIYPPSLAEPALAYGIFDLSTHKVYPGETLPFSA